MSKPLTLHCSQRLCNLLANILRDYARAAYPEGGSECSQSARESLLVAADGMRDHWSAGSQSTTLSKRLRVQMKSAISYYLQGLASGEADTVKARESYLLSVLQGEVIDDDGYYAAELKDGA